MANLPMSNLKTPMPAKATGDTQPGMSFRGLLGSAGTRLAAPFHLAMIDNRTGENYNQLKLTAEKMMQEQACMSSEIQMMKTKLLKSEEQVGNLESKVLEMSNENAMLKVKHNDDIKVWKGLDSKFLATTTFCDHLAETLGLLEVQLEEAEQSKPNLERKLAEREKFYEDTKSQVDDMLARIRSAEDMNKQYGVRMAELSDNLQQNQKMLDAEYAKFTKLNCERDDLQQQLTKAVSRNEEDKATIESRTAEMEQLIKELLSKAEDVANLQKEILSLVQARGEVECQLKDLQNSYNLALKDNDILRERMETLNVKTSELQKANDVATSTIENLTSETARRTEQAEEEKKVQQKTLNELVQKLTEQEKYTESIRQNLRERAQELENVLKKATESDAELEIFKDEVISMRQENSEKKQRIEQMSQQEEKLKREMQEMRGQLNAAENASKEISLRFKHQLEAKQAELTSHLHEISLRNNQEMADMRRKYEAETREAAAKEKRKGEAALEAIKQAADLQLSRELDAATQRLKRAQTDHEDMVRVIKQASEEEKKKIVELHAEELQKVQQELRAETEKRCGDISVAFQDQNEELQKSHHEEIKKLQALLLETADEVATTKEQMRKLDDDHKEELATKIQEIISKSEQRSREHEAEILRLTTSSTKIIEEWKSKALLWELEFIKLHTATPKPVEVATGRAQSANTPFNSREDVSTAKDDEIKRADSAERSRDEDMEKLGKLPCDEEQKQEDSADYPRSVDMKLSRMLLIANSSVTRDDEHNLADSNDNSGSNDRKELRTLQSSNYSNRRVFPSHIYTSVIVQTVKANSAKDDHTHSDLRYQKNQTISASSSHRAKRGQLHSIPANVISLEDSQGKQVARNLSTPNKMIAEHPLRPNTEPNGTTTRRRKAGSKVAGQECDKTKTSYPCSQKSKRKTKRVKFMEKQQSDMRSKALSDFFELEELMDPYDDPYAFNE